MTPITKEKLEEIRARLMSTPAPTKMLHPAIWPYYAAAAQAIDEFEKRRGELKLERDKNDLYRAWKARA